MRRRATLLGSIMEWVFLNFRPPVRLQVAEHGLDHRLTVCGGCSIPYLGTPCARGVNLGVKSIRGKILHPSDPQAQLPPQLESV